MLLICERTVFIGHANRIRYLLGENDITQQQCLIHETRLLFLAGMC
jgi:hypothetical protein